MLSIYTSKYVSELVTVCSVYINFEDYTCLLNFSLILMLMILAVMLCYAT